MRSGTVRNVNRAKCTARVLLAPVAAVIVAAMFAFGGVPAVAAPPGVAGGNPVIPAAPPTAAVPAVGAQAVQDGTWHVGEVGLWRDSGFRGSLYDTGSSIIYSYTCCRFVNSSLYVNDRVSSIANAQNGYRWAYEHAGYAGGSVIMLPYGQCNASTCYSYSSLGWANDKLSSHAHY